MIFLWSRSYSQDVYQIGVSQKSIEPEQSFVSLPLGGYAAPWEGRFTLQWIFKDQLSSVTAICGLDNYLFVISNNNLLRMDLSGSKFQWKKMGAGDNIKLLAGFNNKLFAVTTDKKLLKARKTDRKVVWKVIDSVNRSVIALAAMDNKLYAANEDGSLWMADISNENMRWKKVESLELENIISLAANDRKLFALTKEGTIYHYEISKRPGKWIKTAYKNGVTIKENIRYITIADDMIYGVSEESALYEGEHRSKGDLSARAVAIKDDKSIVVVVSLDVVGINDRFIGFVKDEIFQKTGIPSSAVFINMSHTHFAPVTQDWSTWQEHNQHPDSVYLYSTIRGGIIEAVTEATKNMYPAELFFGRGKTDIGYNRSLNDHPELYDRDVDVIKVDYVNKNADNYLFIAACHPVFSTMGKLHYTISANYPGVARKLIEERTGTSNSIFLQGTAGDINPKDNGENITGEKLANEVISILNRSMNKITGPISFFLDTISIPITPMRKKEIITFRAHNRGKPGNMETERNLNWCDLMLKYYEEDKMPSSLPVYVQTINIGNWKLIGFSRETTTEYSLEAKRIWSESMVSVTGYTNDVSSYLPTKKHIEKLNYEGYGSFFWYGMPNIFPATVDSTIITFIKLRKH